MASQLSWPINCLVSVTSVVDNLAFRSGQTNDNAIKTSDTVLRKIYFSLYLKGLCVRWTCRPNRTATYWPQLYWPSAFLSRSPGLLNRGPGGPASLGHVPQSSIFSPTDLISKLTDFLSSQSYIIVQRPPSCGHHNFVLIQPVHGQGYNILIFLNQMHLLFTQVHFLFWQPGWVVGQYTTIFYLSNFCLLLLEYILIFFFILILSKLNIIPFLLYGQSYVLELLNFFRFNFKQPTKPVHDSGLEDLRPCKEKIINMSNNYTIQFVSKIRCKYGLVIFWNYCSRFQ